MQDGRYGQDGQDRRYGQDGQDGQDGLDGQDELEGVISRMGDMKKIITIGILIIKNNAYLCKLS